MEAPAGSWDVVAHLLQDLAHVDLEGLDLGLGLLLAPVLAVLATYLTGFFSALGAIGSHACIAGLLREDGIA